jgi:hypothetical protein
MLAATDRRKDKTTESQKDKTTERQRDKKTEKQKGRIVLFTQSLSLLASVGFSLSF